MLNRLTAIAAKRAGPGRHADGGGLYLEKTDSSAKWIFRYSFAGRRRDMGLGRLTDVSLAQARSERDRWAACIARGIDPISERDRVKAAAAAEIDRVDPTLEDLVRKVFDARKGSMKNDGESGRWLSPFTTHIFPRIGSRPARSVTEHDLVRVLEPIWKAKPNAAKKAYTRLRTVFVKGEILGFDVTPLTVDRAREHLGEIQITPTNIASTDWTDIPALFERLSGEHGDASGRMCLRFIMLTVVRSESARGARFSEIDGNVWTIPAERMKGLKGKVADFRVPLSGAAMKIVERARALSNNPDVGLVFPSPLDDAKPLAQNALLNVLNDMGEPGRPHGFRSSFRTWVQDTDAATFEVAETALAHKIGGLVERSYARSDLLDRRALLMERWAAHVTGEEGKIVKFHATG